MEWKEKEGREKKRREGIVFFTVWLEEMDGKGNKLNPLGSRFSICPNQAEIQRTVLEITILPISLLLTCPLHEGIKVKNTFFFFCKPNK